MAGQTASWNIQVNNVAPASNTSGTTSLSDTLPAGYTLSSYNGTGWTCSGMGTGTAACTSSQVVSGGFSYNTLALTVNVPSNSPSLVSNTAAAYGGGDLNAHQPGRRGDEQHGCGERNRRPPRPRPRTRRPLQQQRQERHAFCHRHQPGGNRQQGTLTFSVFQGATQIGSSTSPAGVTNGSASATLHAARRNERRDLQHRGQLHRCGQLRFQ